MKMSVEELSDWLDLKMPTDTCSDVMTAVMNVMI